MEVKCENILAVEGKDEEIFFKVFLKHLEIGEVQIFNVGGKDNFTKELKTLKAVSGFEKVKKLGLVRDADENFENAFQSIKMSLEKCGFKSPKEAISFTENEKINTGIYIMPNSCQCGMLETLCLESIFASKEIFCIEKIFECLEFSPKNIYKSKILIYLALKTPLVNSLGLAAEKNIWDFEHQCFEKLKNFVKNFKK